MLSLSSAYRLAAQMTRRAPAFQSAATRAFVAPKLGERDANYAWLKSCYSGIDYTISDDATVYEAVEKFAAYGVGNNFSSDLFHFASIDKYSYTRYSFSPFANNQDAWSPKMRMVSVSIHFLSRTLELY